MSRTKHTEVFKYEELSEDAQAKARDWFREASAGDADSLEHVIEDAATCGAFLGINLRTRSVKLMDGGTRYEPCVYWSGFSSQGDGACFEGTWTAGDVSPVNLRMHAPKDAELHRIADALAEIATAYPDASASTKQRGHYQHSGCMSVETDCGELTPEQLARYVSPDDKHADPESAEQYQHDRCEQDFPEDDLIRLLRDFADWIYAQLEREYEWQNADEQVAENIIINEYEFTADGHIA